MTQLIINVEVFEPWHGSLYGYNSKACRCEECTEAARIYRAKRRAEQHGPVDLCECGRLLPHKGRCGPEPVPRHQPFVW